MSEVYSTSCAAPFISRLKNRNIGRQYGRGGVPVNFAVEQSDYASRFRSVAESGSHLDCHVLVGGGTKRTCTLWTTDVK